MAHPVTWFLPGSCCLRIETLLCRSSLKPGCCPALWPSCLWMTSLRCSLKQPGPWRTSLLEQPGTHSRCDVDWVLKWSWTWAEGVPTNAFCFRWWNTAPFRLLLPCCLRQCCTSVSKLSGLWATLQVINSAASIWTNEVYVCVFLNILNKMKRFPKGLSTTFKPCSTFLIWTAVLEDGVLGRFFYSQMMTNLKSLSQFFCDNASLLLWQVMVPFIEMSWLTATLSRLCLRASLQTHL